MRFLIRCIKVLYLKTKSARICGGAKIDVETRILGKVEKRAMIIITFNQTVMIREGQDLEILV